MRYKETGVGAHPRGRKLVTAETKLPSDRGMFKAR